MHSKLGVLLRSAALAQIVFVPVAHAARSGGSLPPSASVSFPKQVGAFKKQGPTKPDMFGFPTATYWAGASGWATVYFYPSGGQSLAQGYAAARDQVKIASPSAKLRADRAERISVSGAPRNARRAIFTLNAPGNVPAKSQLIMFSNGSYFLKFRITYKLAHADRFDREVERFLAAFPWPGS